MQAELRGLKQIQFCCAAETIDDLTICETFTIPATPRNKSSSSQF